MLCDDRSPICLGARQNIPQALTLFGIACYLRSGVKLNPELYAFGLKQAFGLSHAFEAPRAFWTAICFQSTEAGTCFQHILGHESYPAYPRGQPFAP